jgi:hypothetical protein
MARRRDMGRIHDAHVAHVAHSPVLKHLGRPRAGPQRGLTELRLGRAAAERLVLGAACRDPCRPGSSASTSNDTELEKLHRPARLLPEHAPPCTSCLTGEAAESHARCRRGPVPPCRRGEPPVVSAWRRRRSRGSEADERSARRGGGRHERTATMRPDAPVQGPPAAACHLSSAGAVRMRPVARSAPLVARAGKLRAAGRLF